MRSPDAEAEAVPVVLRKDLARSIRQGHPWLYRDALSTPDAIEDGAVVEIRTRDGRPLARGFWDAHSPIAARLLESGGPGHRFRDSRELARERLRIALSKRLDGLDTAATNAFRWVHGEADLLPGIHVDVYGQQVVVRFDGGGARAFYASLDSWLREAASGLLQIEQVIDRALRTSSEATECTVRENNLLFVVDLAHAQKGGLFLDQRENRQRVAERSAGKNVLNLFGYTGGFSVYAAAAGASSTDTVDIARPAIEGARRNFEVNGIDLTRHGFHAMDAFVFLERAIERGQTWDIVVSDPPSFAPRKDAVAAARGAYRRLHRLAASVTARGGLLCPASCSSHFPADEFLASVEDGVRLAARRWALDEVHGAAFDHPVIPAFPEGEYLKFAMGRVL